MQATVYVTICFLSQRESWFLLNSYNLKGGGGHRAAAAAVAAGTQFLLHRMCCTPSHTDSDNESRCVIVDSSARYMMSMEKNQLQYELNLERGNGAIRNSGEISKLWFYIRKRHRSLFFCL